MTDAYLRSLGFVPTAREPRASVAPFSQAWRYQFDHLAQDGVPLFIEHPLGIAGCRLSVLVAPIAAQDIFAEIPLDSQSLLEEAMRAFFAVHGGIGKSIPPSFASGFRPYHHLD